MLVEVHRLLMGSIGDDSHSVGMTLLELAFKEAGFLVKNLGILNRLDDFFLNASNYDIIFISCMNGHVDLYLKDFPFKLKHFQRLQTQQQPQQKVWYLGGNLSVQGEEKNIIKKYRRMGFDFVSPKPIGCDEIMHALQKDLYNKGIKKRKTDAEKFITSPSIPLADQVDDGPLSNREFLEIRKEVLGSWSTGSSVWDVDIKKNHANPQKNFHNLLVQRSSNGKQPLVQPRTGVAHTRDQIEILTTLRKKGLEISSVQLDAASRKKMFHEATEGVRRSQIGGTSFLNGYPVPVHGVAGVEKILHHIDTPFQVRAGSPDHRLVYEISLAGGASAVEGGFICYLFPYDKNTSPVQSLNYWKYVDKLADYYYKSHNIIINREYFGPLTCCLIEPTIPICINIVQAILSAKSGARCISVGLAEQGNRWQDIAAVKVLEKMTCHYLSYYRLNHCTVTTVFHQYMAAFPSTCERSEQLILQSSITGTMANANRFLTKTPVEADTIPNWKDNARGLALTHQGIKMAKDEPTNPVKINREARLLERQVRTIMSSIQKLGQGSVARGIIKAFETGILDIPFSPSIYNANTLITARDRDGAVRFVNPDQLPFDDDILDFHKEQIHQRMTAERNSRVFEAVEKDLTRIMNNDYLKWPLNGNYLY